MFCDALQKMVEANHACSLLLPFLLHRNYVTKDEFVKNTSIARKACERIGLITRFSNLYP